jgi:hypothetical protein
VTWTPAGVGVGRVGVGVARLKSKPPQPFCLHNYLVLYLIVFLLQSTLLTRTVTQLLHERIPVLANVTTTERENVLSTFSGTPSHSISFPHPRTQEHTAVGADTESFRQPHADLDHISEYLTPSRAYIHTSTNYRYKEPAGLQRHALKRFFMLSSDL